MKYEYIDLCFDDPEMARAIAESAPPEGVKVSGPSTLIQASDPARIVEQIIIEFIPQFSATVLAGWILLAMEKRANKRTSINREEVDLKESDIVRLIENQLADQKAREAQWQAEYEKEGEQVVGEQPPSRLESDS